MRSDSKAGLCLCKFLVIVEIFGLWSLIYFCLQKESYKRTRITAFMNIISYQNLGNLNFILLCTEMDRSQAILGFCIHISSLLDQERSNLYVALLTCQV